MKTITLKEFRIQRGILQTDIAVKYGISQSYYSLIENGHRIPSLEIAMRISTAFNVPINEVYRIILNDNK